MKLEFKPEDFKGCQLEFAEQNEWVASAANKRLAEMLAEAPTVYQTDFQRHWTRHASGSSPKKRCRVAKLVCIEEIGK